MFYTAMHLTAKPRYLNVVEPVEALVFVWLRIYALAAEPLWLDDQYHPFVPSPAIGLLQ